MKPAAPSRLQADLAHRILTRLRQENAAPGHHLVELELCAAFDVSRTPVRGALKLLERQGVVKARESRGYVLARLPPETAEPETGEENDEHRLFQALAEGRAKGALPDQFTQQELGPRFDPPLPAVLAVLRELAGRALIGRPPGKGGASPADPARTLSESYAFRRALEPQLLLQPGFR